MINEDQTFDIIGGAAGAILGLLSLYKSSNNPQVLEKAIKCGHHLINNWVINKSDTGKNRTLTGFAHGAAGIAYALICLYEITGQTGLLQLPSKPLLMNRVFFCAEEANWPDFRQENDNDPAAAYMRSWCHGAPGIG
jgi:lantibiotic modifying enzyme